MKDLIKREDAIDAIEGTDWYHQNRNKDMVSGANSDEHQAWYKAEDVYKALETIPSADRPRGEIDAVREYEHQVHNLEQGYITLGEFDKRIEPLRHLYYDRPTWIPCSERLPRAKYGESENVLASCESGHIHLLYFDGGNWCYPTGEAYEHNFDPVIAWMPLPEPWKGADDEID